MDYQSVCLKDCMEIREIVSLHYFQYRSDFYFPGETHPFWEFVCVDAGEITVEAGEETHLLKKGDILLLMGARDPSLEEFCKSIFNNL